MRDSSSKITTFMWHRFPSLQVGTAIAVRNCIPHNHVNLPPLVSIETWSAYRLETAKFYLQLFKNSRSDADVINLLSLRNKSLLAGDLDAKNPVRNSQVSKPSCEKFLTLLINNDFQISVPQSPTHYTPPGSCDVLDIMIHQNVRLSESLSQTCWT
jgi:hypothetical protein